MNTIPILFTFDQTLLMPAGVCISSLLVNADPDTFYDIFILHKEGCDFSELRKLEQRFSNFRLTCREVKGEFVGAYEIRGIPETAYYRLLAPELITEYDKLLYSDVDVIIREDLSKYYNIDLGENYFAGVDNCSRLRPAVRNYLSNSLNLDWQKGYYYSGNLVINSALIRQNSIIEKFRELGKNKYAQQDMDIINIACNGSILPIGPSYCLTVQLYDLIASRYEEMKEIYGAEEISHALNSGIVHYNGAKPWKEVCPNMDIWWSYYRKSVFYDEKFTHDFWEDKTYLLEKMPLVKRIKLVGRYFRKGGRM